MLIDQLIVRGEHRALSEFDPPGLSLRDRLAMHERDIITASIQEHGGNLSAVAKALGISRPTLYDRIERLGIAKAPQ